ncbi:LysM domain-containing protein [Archangium sp.]|jgi:hypothetical protein|uniref:LysM peptidoglycan-binding domain-containing protein n=1 Tax=Archangium sp. TaxID=1872627 RepID=UPI002ED88869
MALAPPDYIVQKNDTLSKIASRIYGDERRWAEVYSYNSRVIGKDANAITLGTRLLLPPKDFRLSEKERTAIIKTAARLRIATAVMSKAVTTQGGSSAGTSNTPRGGGPAQSRTTSAPQTSKTPGNNAALTAELTKLFRNVGVAGPEKFLKFLQVVLKLDEKTTKDVLALLSKKESGLKAVELFAKAYEQWQKGNGQAAFAYMAEGAASGWGLLSDSQRSKIMDTLLTPLRGRFSALADILKMTKSTDAMKVVSGLMRGEMDDVVKGLSGVVKHLLAEQGIGKEKIAKIVAALASLLPERIRDKTMKKIVGRKVPVLGTLIVGVTDIYNIARKPGDWTNWAGLVSTVAGAFPGVGTAASTAIDLAVLVNEIGASVKEIQKLIQVPVTAVP